MIFALRAFFKKKKEEFRKVKTDERLDDDYDEDEDEDDPPLAT